MSEDSIRLNNLVDRFLEAYNNFYPHNASFILGLHEYDGRVPDFSSTAIEKWQQNLTHFLKELKTTVDYNTLSKLEQFDYKLVESQLEFEQLRHGSLHFYERNPVMPYLYIFDVSNYVKRNYAPLEQRVEALCSHLEAMPRLIEQLEQKLAKTLPRPVVEIALETFGGFARYYNGDLVEIEDLETYPLLQARLKQAAALAGAALNNYVNFFKAHLARADMDFAIGPENYLAMLRWGDQVDLPLGEVLQIGLSDLAQNQAALREVCARIDPTRPIEEVIRRVCAEHPDNQNLVNTTQRYLEGIRQHLLDAQLVDVPSEVRCIVAETPLFMRWVFADMETPGPFETVATEAHFYITPANPDWPLEQQERWLSRFNDYVIQVFSLHEAYPGHYLQHLHARHSPSKAAKNLSSYSFVEGWAHYCEQMMLEEGYGRADPVIYAKLQLAQLLEALVRDCRYICSLGLHTQGWTVEQALKFYQENAWLEEITAQKEALRSTFDPGGLNYTLGKLMFYKLRADYQAEKGQDFQLRSFHNECLAYGMPPVPLLRSLLLEQTSGQIFG